MHKLSCIFQQGLPTLLHLAWNFWAQISLLLQLYLGQGFKNVPPCLAHTAPVSLLNTLLI